MKDADTRVLESDLSAAIGANVSIRHKPGGAGSVTINYKSLDELDGICRLPLGTLAKTLKKWRFNAREKKIAGELIREIVSRVDFLPFIAGQQQVKSPAPAFNLLSSDVVWLGHNCSFFFLLL